MRSFISLALFTTVSTSFAASPVNLESLKEGKLSCTVVSMKQSVKDLGPYGLNPFGKTTVEINSSELNLPFREVDFGDKAWTGYIVYREENAARNDFNFYLNFKDPRTQNQIGFGNFNIQSSLVHIDEKRLKLKSKDYDVSFEVNFKTGRGLYRYSVRMGGWPMNNVTRHEARVELEDCRI